MGKIEEVDKYTCEATLVSATEGTFILQIIPREDGSFNVKIRNDKNEIVLDESGSGTNYTDIYDAIETKFASEEAAAIDAIGTVLGVS